MMIYNRTRGGDMDGVTVTNIMADGTICNDLSTYLDENHHLPVEVKNIMLDMMRRGAEIRRKEAILCHKIQTDGITPQQK